MPAGPRDAPRFPAVPADAPCPRSAPVPGATPAAAGVDVDAASALCLAPAPGKMAGIFGPGAFRPALAALARPLLAGETIVAVDGANRFDPYAIGRAARALGGDGKAALARIRISRAFTCHQMEALLARRLVPEMARIRAGLAVVLGLPETFRDADVPFAEACRLFRRCLSALRRAAAGGARVVLVGDADGEETARIWGARILGGSEERKGFVRHLVRTADPALLLRREGGTWTGTLLRGGDAFPPGLPRSRGNGAGERSLWPHAAAVPGAPGEGGR